MWNQLVSINETSITNTVNDVVITDNRDGSYTVNGTASALITFRVNYINYIQDHKYYVKGCPAGGGSLTYDIHDFSGFGPRDNGEGGIKAVIQSGTTSFGICVRKDATVSNLVF